MAKISYYEVANYGCPDEVLGLLELHSNKTLEKQDTFKVGFSGGSVASMLSEGLINIRSDFEKWQVFLCDERYVPNDSADSTFGHYKRELLGNDACPLKESQIEKINLTLPLEECAAEYEKRIRKAFKLENSKDIPSFDLLILGIGPDGHTCSLFPDHPLLKESTKLIGSIDNSPKNPPKRISMTYPILNAAKICLFSATGEGKSEILKKILVDKDQKLPVTRVLPENGTVIFVVDEAAAKLITKNPSTGETLEKAP